MHCVGMHLPNKAQAVEYQREASPLEGFAKAGTEAQ